MIDYQNLTDSEKLQVAQDAAKNIRNSLPKEIYAGAFTLNSKLPWKAMMFRELLLHRFSDFVDAAIHLYEKGQLIPAFALTRAIIENTALLYWLLVKVEQFGNDRDIGPFDDFLMKGLMGGKTDLTDLKSYNILTAIDHIEKRYKGTREEYDRLSEFTHPNYSGVMGSYSFSEPEKFITYLGKDVKQVPTEFGLIPLLVCLEVFIDDYNTLGPAIKAINDSFDPS